MTNFLQSKRTKVKGFQSSSSTDINLQLTGWQIHYVTHLWYTDFSIFSFKYHKTTYLNILIFTSLIIFVSSCIGQKSEMLWMETIQIHKSTLRVKKFWQHQVLEAHVQGLAATQQLEEPRRMEMRVQVRNWNLCSTIALKIKI